jgi:N-glycosylase/DNA lyase
MLNRKAIRERLKEFQSLNQQQKFQELQFCLLTPQSKAQKCWQAVQELSRIKNPSYNQITKILSTKTRFHHTKAKRILNSKKIWEKIQPLLSESNTLSLRNSIANEVSGYGLKEASHFLRNIGLSKNKIAILDRHILRNLKVEKIKSPKHYLEIEQQFLNHANSINVPPDELDLLWWSRENGEIFK